MYFSCITQLVVLCYGSSKKLMHHPKSLKDMWPQERQVRDHISILPPHFSLGNASWYMKLTSHLWETAGHNLSSCNKWLGRESQVTPDQGRPCIISLH